MSSRTAPACLFVLSSIFAAGCGSGGESPTADAASLQLEVILRERYPQATYPGTRPTTAMAIPMQAFGVTPTNEESWRDWSYEQIRDAFAAWLASNVDIQGRLPDAVGLNFEKQFNWLDPRNHSSIRHAFDAARELLGNDAELGLYGVPYRVLRGESERAQYETAEARAFVADLDADFIIPVLYLGDDTPDWIDLVEERTLLSLDIAAGFDREARPYCWHRLSSQDVSAATADLLEEHDPGLARTLGLQVFLMDALGVQTAYLWHVEDDVNLAAATALVTAR